MRSESELMLRVPGIFFTVKDRRSKVEVLIEAVLAGFIKHVDKTWISE